MRLASTTLPAAAKDWISEFIRAARMYRLPRRLHEGRERMTKRNLRERAKGKRHLERKHPRIYSPAILRMRASESSTGMP